jgi:hypothetical protein
MRHINSHSVAGRYVYCLRNCHKESIALDCRECLFQYGEKQ